MSKIIVISPDTKTVCEHEIKKMDELYDVLGCQLIEFVNLQGDRQLVVDEEGLLYDKTLFKIPVEVVTYRQNDGIFAGKSAIVKLNNSEENLLDCALSDLDFEVIFENTSTK